MRYPCSDTSASTAGHRPPSQRAAHRQNGRPDAGMGARLDTEGLRGQSRRRPAAQPVARPRSRDGTAWPAVGGLDWPGHGARGGVTLLRAGRRSARFFSAQLGFPTHLYSYLNNLRGALAHCRSTVDSAITVRGTFGRMRIQTAHLCVLLSGLTYAAHTVAAIKRAPKASAVAQAAAAIEAARQEAAQLLLFYARPSKGHLPPEPPPRLTPPHPTPQSGRAGFVPCRPNQ